MGDTTDSGQAAKSTTTSADVVVNRPPSWLPAATLAVVPITLVVAIVNPFDGTFPAAAPWGFAFFVMSVFIMTWATPASTRARIAVLTAGLLVAAAGAGSLVALDEWAEDDAVDAGALDADNAGRRLVGARLDGLDGSGMSFAGADLRAASAVGAVFTGASFAGADLRGADLSGARLEDACFRGADLRGATLDGASVDGSDFSGALIDGGASNAIDVAVAPHPSPCR